MQIEFLKIFDKFSKIPLIEVAMGGRPVAAVGGRLAADGDRQQMTLGGDKDSLVFLLWQIFLFYENVGFPSEVEIFWG